MSNDEQAIREVVAEWMQATRDGDSEAVLNLMADDAKFLVAGEAPFGKEVFAQAARDPNTPQMKIDAQQEILEINVVGEWAFMLTHLTVSVDHPDAGTLVRKGNTLTVLTKRDNQWLLHRDANLLVPVDGAS